MQTSWKGVKEKKRLKEAAYSGDSAVRRSKIGRASVERENVKVNLLMLSDARGPSGFVARSRGSEMRREAARWSACAGVEVTSDRW